MTDKDFEAKLRADLPRGHARQPKSGGREHALFSRWLTPAEITGEHWLNPAELTGDEWKAKSGLLLGRREGRLIGWRDDRHVMTIAGSRAGKGVSLIIPN